MPSPVQDGFGYALFLAQSGDKSNMAKPLKGFASTEVVEIVQNWNSDTFRAVYTVKFEGAVYVLHCFQKKSKRGISTPKADIDLIKERLQALKQSISRKMQ